jgi:Fic family protein
MLPEESSKTLENLAFDLILESSSLAGQIHPIVVRSVGDLVRSMNCYYSNFIEGHNTHPRDIDRALRADFVDQPKRRDLQKEALAHIWVQKAIDEGLDSESPALTGTYAKWVHREFCSRLPDDMLWIEESNTKRKIRVVPGELRDGEVQVGQHVPPAASALPRFLARFDEAYNSDQLSKVRQVIATAAAHHRFAWIHPFYDGNGRVVRLMTHAMLKRLGVGNSLWSVARGLARRVEQYKRLLADADQQRHSDLDGRGALSQEALVSFCRFFLDTCIDQVKYMRSVLEPTKILNRLEIYTQEEIAAKKLMKGSFTLLREALLAGEFERGRAAAITGYKERSARAVVSRLIKNGLLVSDTPKSPVRIGFPIGVVERLFPSLYPTDEPL